SQADDPREYTTEMLVPPSSPLVGKTLEEAGLRHLPGAYVAEIERDGQVTVAVSSEERLRANDRLVFVGVVESVVDLRKSRGLLPATDQVFKLDSARSDRCLIEAVVSDSCPLVGKTIRDGRFRSVYNAAIIAVARNGVRLRKKIGDIVLTSGDTLLLEAKPSFAEQQRDSRDFFLVSRIEDSQPPRHERALVALAILALMVLAVTAGWLNILPAAMLAAGFMLLTRCCRSAEARRNVDWQVLLVIAAALGIGKALQRTGAAAALAELLIDLAGDSPHFALLLIYLVTAAFTATITNVAAAALVFPIALAAAGNLNVNFIPFAMTIMMAASASFATPIGYQTNMMVYGAGGYRFSDYLRMGLPLTLLVGAVTVLLAPVIWPF
ncbi:MAG: SLC13 family permease, partial [Phycisphaerae bacterium]